MKQIIDDYSPILEDVPFEEIKDKVNKSKTKKSQNHLVNLRYLLHTRSRENRTFTKLY